MPVVNIRHMLMRVVDRLVGMGMGMLDGSIVPGSMVTVMMTVIMRVPMFMDDFFMPMAVPVLLRNEEDRSDDHDGQGRREQSAGCFPKQDEGKDDAG